MHAETRRPLRGHGAWPRAGAAADPPRTRPAASRDQRAWSSRRSAAASMSPASNSHLTGAKRREGSFDGIAVEPFARLPLEVLATAAADRRRPALPEASASDSIETEVARHHDLGGLRQRRPVAVFALAEDVQPVRRRDGALERGDGVLRRARARLHTEGPVPARRIGAWRRWQVRRPRRHRAGPERRGRRREARWARSGVLPAMAAAAAASGMESSTTLRGGRDAVLRGGDDEIEVACRACGPAEADGARAALRLALDLARDHAGRGLRAEHEIGPGRATRFAVASAAAMTARESRARETEPLHLEGPARGLGKRQHLVEVALAAARQDPDAGGQRPCCSARASRSTSV